MQFEKGYIYHIFNQGNNRQKIFFSRENYLFFLRKMRKHLLPYCDVLAYCLMPNHFHWMVRVNTINIQYHSLGVSQRHAETNETKTRSFNASIGIMLMSYTKAVNKQQERTGKLFREATKAECVNCPAGITPSFIKQSGITVIMDSQPEKQYPQICFNYIHENPVKTKLVSRASDWEFSSAADYAGLRKGTLVNKKLAAEYIEF